MTVSSFLLKRGEEEKATSAFDVFVTDSLGHFAFRADITGKWNMILSVSEKGKKKTIGSYWTDFLHLNLKDSVMQICR